MSAKGNKIVLSDKPRGVQMEVTVDGALKPGTVVQIKNSSGIDDNGRLTVEAATPGSDGAALDDPLMVLDAMFEWGQLATDAYVSGEPGRVYIPPVGERLNVLFKDVTGTGESFSFGDLVGIDNGTGLIIADSTFAFLPFKVLSALSAITEDTLNYVLVRANQSPADA